MTGKILSLVLLTIFTLSACAPLKKSENILHESRFVIISEDDYGFVVYDEKTGVEYWMCNSSHNRGTLTLLVDRDGKPLIYEGA